VKAGQHPGELNVVTAVIPGADPKLRDEEIAFSCHLDHQRPGANDNASGCVTILEVARTLQKLVSEGKLAPPARTLRFIWPPEVEGTLTLLNAKPEFAKRIKAVVHMDMVGGGPATKAIFHVTRGPMSLPSFVYDVGEAFGDFVNRESDEYAGTGEALYPFVSPEGGKEALQADFADFSMGSDHEVYEEGSFRIPAIYLNDWPDRYIHTNGDVAANIDPTKLKRAAFIGAASGYFLAQFHTAQQASEVEKIIRENTRLQRAAIAYRKDAIERDGPRIPTELPFFREHERDVLLSMNQFAPSSVQPDWIKDQGLFIPLSDLVQSSQVMSGDETLIFVRNADPKGPMTIFGYDYLTDHLAAMNLSRPKLLDYKGLWGSGEEYAYETLNSVDGKRNAEEIREAVSTEYGHVPLKLVLEYLKSLESIGVLRRVK
jgi:aminopeptidase YwaD